MGNLLTKTGYYAEERLVRKSLLERTMTVKSGEGTFVKGQCFKYDSTTLQLVKTTSTAGFVVVALEAGDATSAAVKCLCLVDGTVNAFALVGFDFIADTTVMATPAAPTAALVTGGTLTAATHTYKTVGLKGNAKTIAGSTASVVTHVATAGYATGAVVANIAAVNAILGDCSAGTKTVVFNVDGVINSASFALDYSGAGALGAHANLITALGTSITPTSSDGAAIRLTSKTTGAASIVHIISDTTGLFTTPTEVVGTAIEKTVRVTPAVIPLADGYEIWRTIDGGSTWKYIKMSAAQIATGYITDDGSAITWSGSLTPLAATDVAGVKLAEAAGILIEEVNTGYSFREVD